MPPRQLWGDPELETGVQDDLVKCILALCVTAKAHHFVRVISFSPHKNIVEQVMPFFIEPEALLVV